MTNEVPGSGTPGAGQPPEAGTTAGGWPEELVPPPAAPPDAVPPAPGAGVPAPAPAAPAAPAPAPAAPESSVTWGTTPSSGTWGAPAQAPAPVPQDATPTQVWGAPPAAAPDPAAPTAAAPAPTTWGAPAAAPDPAAPAAPAAWGTPPPAAGAPIAYPAPAPAPQQPQTWGAATPPPAGGWGAPPAGAQPPVQPGQPGQWGAPPPGAGYAGGPPPGTWAPAPAKGSNGCLKACLIVGVILVVIGIIGAIAISIFAARFAEGIGVNPDGSLKSCELISNDELSGVLGSGAEALPMGGLVDGTIGQLLDQRILADAPECWIVASGSADTGTTGRLARQDGGDTSGDFARYRQAAQAGGYLGGDVSGYGDEAFCTAATEAMSFGILVRSGGKLAYVSLIDAESMQNGDFQMGPDGQMLSPSTCAKAGEIAEAMLN